jgi:hypothetical protein
MGMGSPSKFPVDPRPLMLFCADAPAGGYVEGFDRAMAACVDAKRGEK